MARTPILDSMERPRALVCAFCAVPGASSEGVRAEQLLLGFSHAVEIDALTLKSSTLSHIQRLGRARMLRVPVPELPSHEATEGRGIFHERLASFRRALTRQLDAERYNVVIALDLFAAAAVTPLLHEAKLVIEVGDLPSLSFAQRYPVDAADADTKRSWEANERAALKAASLILAPSRQAARVISERADPRIIRVAPRMVDTRVYRSPSVEVALDDVKTVAFWGGREGGARSVAVTAAIRALLARAPDARVLVLGTPSRSERQLIDELTRRGLGDRVVAVDINAPADLVQAICAAHVVVVAAGVEGDVFGVPHRALEAMAVGRAVVVTGTEASFKDTLQNGVHARVVPQNAPEELAAAVVALLDDDVGRGGLARAGQKQAQRQDLATRLKDIAQTLTEGSGVLFEAQLPPLEEVTAPAPIARVLPATPLRLSQATAVSAPVAELSRPSGETKATSKKKTRSTKTASTSKPSLTSAVDAPTGDVWAGDTLLDPLALRSPSSDPAPARVKKALLQTELSAAEPSAPQTKPETSSTVKRPRIPTGVRSLQVGGVGDGDDEDDWSRDTIADASPVVVERTRQSADPRPTTHPPRSFLVEVGADVTAEDRAHTDGDDSSSSSG